MFRKAVSDPGLVPLCWWKKSCTTWDVWISVNNEIFACTISAGAGFQPSTVWFIYSLPRTNVVLMCPTFLHGLSIMTIFTIDSRSIKSLKPLSDDSPTDIWVWPAWPKKLLVPQKSLVRCWGVSARQCLSHWGGLLIWVFANKKIHANYEVLLRRLSRIQFEYRWPWTTTSEQIDAWFRWRNRWMLGDVYLLGGKTVKYGCF